MPQLNRKQGISGPKERPTTVPYAPSGHPSLEQLMVEQRTGPITDVSELHWDFWPEDESVEEFAETVREWRGHGRLARST